MKRNRRAGVEDRWTKTIRDESGNARTVPSARHGKGMRWLARYVDDRGREHTKAFGRKSDAQQWLDKNGISPVARAKFDDFMNQTPQGAKGPRSENDREALFRQFQAWQADQAAKENARAQAPTPPAPAVRASRHQKEQ